MNIFYVFKSIRGIARLLILLRKRMEPKRKGFTVVTSGGVL